MNINKKFIFNVNELDKKYNFEIYNASTISNPKNNTIIFLKKNSQELLDKLENIKNSILIILDSLDSEKYKKYNLVIYDKNPRFKYAKLMAEILNKNNKKTNIYFKDGYYYGENFKKGNNVIIEPFVKIGDNVEIGDNSIIKTGVKIGDNVEIGENCYIRENSVIGGEGFGIEKDNEGNNFRIPHIGGVKIQNNVEIGALTTICSGTIEPTVVEEYVKVDDHVHVAHNVKLGKGSLVIAGTIIGGSTEIGKETYIGMNSSIKNALKIGKNTKLGMSTNIVKSIENDMILASEMSDTLDNIKKITKYKKELLQKI